MKAFKTILLTAAAAITCLCSCEKESLPNSETKQGVTLTVAQLSGFEDKASTTRAGNFGTPNAGKTVWANGDLILLKISYEDATEPIVGTSIFTTATYNGSTWTIDAAAKNTAGNLAISGSHLILPIGAIKTTVTAYYSPGQEWSTPIAENTKLVLRAGITAGMHEHHTNTATNTNTNTGVVDKIELPAWSTTSSRLRIASQTLAGRTDASIRLTLQGFTPTGGTALTTPTSFDNLTIDTNDNSFFYGTWSATPAFNAHINVVYDNNGKPIHIPSFEHTFTDASTANKSYALDATDEAPTGDTYIGPAAGLIAGAPYYDINIAKNKWIITDDIATITSESDIAKAVKRLAADRRIELTIEKAITIGNKAFMLCKALSSINLPNVTKLGASAFDFCKALISANLPKVTILEGTGDVNGLTFSACDALTTLTFGTALTICGDSFVNCGYGSTNAKNITLTLAADQKKMKWDTTQKTWIQEAGNFFPNTDRKFCGRNTMHYNIFKKIKSAP